MKSGTFLASWSQPTRAQDGLPIQFQKILDRMILFGQSGFIFTAYMRIGNRKQCNELVTPRNVIHAKFGTVLSLR